MTQGFDELNKDDLGYNGFKDFKAGVQSRQAEIDALQKRIDELEAKREGFVLVPKKCTNNMAHAAKSIDGRLSVFKYSYVWDAMLSAVEVQNNGL